MKVRGYSKEIVEAGIAKATAVSRADAIKRVEKVRGEEERQHRLIVKYDRRSCPALATILKSNYEAATARDARFPTMFPKVPKPVFKKGTNIKQLLCRSKVPPVRNINTRSTARENQRGVLMHCLVPGSFRVTRNEHDENHFKDVICIVCV